MTSAERARLRRRLAVAGIILAGALLYASRTLCLRAFVWSGVRVDRCPDGDFVQTLFIESFGLRRGAQGTVRVGAVAHFTTEASDASHATPVRRLTPTLALVKPTGEELALSPVDGWESADDHARVARVVLPDVPDGDYRLRARVGTPIGEGLTDVELPVYAPARVHVLTDRPLYEPGNTVQIRGVVLRAQDLAPLDGRPGRVVIMSPSGEVVLEEKVAVGEFGVGATSFPLDLGAEIGEWRVQWISGPAEDSVTFRVEPFTLPRFSIEARPGKGAYAAHEQPVVRGRVRYSSGAPVRGAEVQLEWTVHGAWPPPPEWLAGELPKSIAADASGAFELVLPRVPKDLRGRATLSARVTAVDAAQDRAFGSASVLLSEDAIDVSAVTELEGGLVQGFNNRVYLRATTAAGAVLRETELLVRRAWDPSDRGTKAITDADGVAALQIDPGPPVNVVVPPMPVRPPPKPPAITRTSVQELVAGRGASLADQRGMDAWTEALEACSRFAADGPETAMITARVDGTGLVDEVVTEDRPLLRCFDRAIRGRRLSSGAPRLYRLTYVVTSDLPRFEVSLTAASEVPEGLEAAILAGALDGRPCLQEVAERTSLPRLLSFRTTPGARAVAVRFEADPLAVSALSPAEVACVESKLARVELPEGVTVTASTLGFARLFVEPPARLAGIAKAMATTRLGYELLIEARAKDELIGKTRLFLAPGQVPDLRLRATPVLASAGETVEVAILRGPEFRGELPEKLWLTHDGSSIEGRVDPKSRTAKFTLPADARGWFACQLGGARALVYVRPKEDLEVSVRPRQPVYAPGDRAILEISTQSGGVGAKAAVGLFGVDQSLADLATLVGPDDMARVRPRATMRAPAFGVLDATALELGRVRGAAAAQAIVSLVAALPSPVELDTPIRVQSAQPFDPIEALTDHFYPVLAELYDVVRAWEEKAPKDESMSPETMARLWDRALDVAEKKKLAVDDAFGRRLRLHRLPSDLLALTDPRAVVVDATRLPEDVENWPEWVEKEKP